MLNGRSAFIYAHPDDETFMSGCLIRQLADEGLKPVLLVATRGDAGNKNGDYAHSSREELAGIRDGEMAEAASILGLDTVEQLGHPDGKLNEVEAHRLALQIVNFANAHDVESLFTFPPDGGNGHPDHIAISLAATLAFQSGKCESVRALYYSMSPGWVSEGRKPDLTIDAAKHWPVKAAALRAHDSQKHAIRRYFGALEDEVPNDRRFEEFVKIQFDIGG
ncbi:PIG-L deacetylase family protein [Cohnella cholangitidis]|uniref:PIG-L family deacetylase n=1 Tax=Cohnella cholangitidis TaxID=2598458 RepID=A0A7G5BSN3_9BACL|nr:PIG-L family deacetylase [Cohnella cholangitidis]QMV39967.1 PIG-L family deacetylase [Cohnella cholangitidis]